MYEERGLQASHMQSKLRECHDNVTVSSSACLRDVVQVSGRAGLSFHCLWLLTY
jgi:hypothetical protein